MLLDEVLLDEEALLDDELLPDELPPQAARANAATAVISTVLATNFKPMVNLFVCKRIIRIEASLTEWIAIADNAVTDLRSTCIYANKKGALNKAPFQSENFFKLWRFFCCDAHARKRPDRPTDPMPNRHGYRRSPALHERAVGELKR